MAVHALKPAASPANTDRTRFNLALARYTNSATARDTLPCPSSIKIELVARDAADCTKAQLAAPPARNLATFTAKLRFILANIGTPPLVAERLTTEIRHLASREAKACAWRHSHIHRAAKGAQLQRRALRSRGYPSTLVEMLSTRVLAGAAARLSRRKTSMMIRAAPNQTCQPEPSTHLETCSRKWEQVTFLIAWIKMMGFNTSARLLSKGWLADELCIRTRTPHFNINRERGAPDATLTDATAASELRGERLLANTRKLREAIQ